MGNACCSEGGNAAENELKGYESRPYTEKDLVTYHYNANQEELLLAYTSQDRQKIVKIQSNFRGHATRKRLAEGNSLINDKMKQYKAGDLINVHNLKMDEMSDESAIYSGQLLKGSHNIK